MDTILVESALSALIAGRCFKQLKKLIQISGTNIYIQTQQNVSADKTSDIIYVTGKKKNVESTLTKLEAIIQQKVGFFSTFLKFPRNQVSNYSK